MDEENLGREFARREADLRSNARKATQDLIVEIAKMKYRSKEPPKKTSRGEGRLPHAGNALFDLVELSLRTWRDLLAIHGKHSASLPWTHESCATEASSQPPLEYDVAPERLERTIRRGSAEEIPLTLYVSNTGNSSLVVELESTIEMACGAEYRELKVHYSPVVLQRGTHSVRIRLGTSDGQLLTPGRWSGRLPIRGSGGWFKLLPVSLDVLVPDDVGESGVERLNRPESSDAAKLPADVGDEGPDQAGAAESSPSEDE